MNAFAQHFTFEFKTGLRSPTLLLMNYLFPLAFYAMMGGVMTQINPGFKELLLPAMVVFCTMVGALLGLPGPLVEAREAGVFRSFKINGVPALSILIVPALTAIFHGLIVSTLVALTAGPIFGGSVPVNWAALALIGVVSACTFGAFGTLIGVVAKESRSTVLLSQAIFLPSMLLGGMMVPLDLLPETVRPVAGLLPSTHAMQALAGLAYGQATVIDPTISLLALAAAAVLAFGLSIYLFNWDSRNDTRHGHPLMGLLVLVPFVLASLLG